MSKNKKISQIKKKIEKFKKKLIHFRIPIAKPNQKHKSKKDYNRQRDKNNLKKEIYD